MNTEKTIGVQGEIDTEAEVDPVEEIDPGIEGIRIIEEINDKYFHFFLKTKFIFYIYFFIFLFFYFLFFYIITKFLIFNDNNKIKFENTKKSDEFSFKVT